MQGLSSTEAAARLKQFGFNQLNPPSRNRGLYLFLSQFKSPLILLLMGAAVLSLFLGGRSDATIILSIVIASGLLSFFQERGALIVQAKLMEIVSIKVDVQRDDQQVRI